MRGVFNKICFSFQYEQEILALRTAMEEMHHKLISSDDQPSLPLLPAEAPTPDVVPPYTPPCSSSPAHDSPPTTPSPKTDATSNRNSRSSNDQEAKNVQMREILET